MIEEWLYAGATDAAARSRLKHLLEVAPPPSGVAASSVGSAPGPRPRSGLSREQAEQMMRDADEWDRSMGAG